MKFWYNNFKWLWLEIVHTVIEKNLQCDPNLVKEVHFCFFCFFLYYFVYVRFQESVCQTPVSTVSPTCWSKCFFHFWSFSTYRCNLHVTANMPAATTDTGWTFPPTASTTSFTISPIFFFAAPFVTISSVLRTPASPTTSPRPHWPITPTPATRSARCLATVVAHGLAADA